MLINFYSVLYSGILYYIVNDIYRVFVQTGINAFLFKNFRASSQLFGHLALIYYNPFRSFLHTKKNANFRSFLSFAVHNTLQTDTKTSHGRSSLKVKHETLTTGFVSAFLFVYYFTHTLGKPANVAYNNLAISANNDQAYTA